MVRRSARGDERSTTTQYSGGDGGSPMATSSLQAAAISSQARCSRSLDALSALSQHASRFARKLSDMLPLHKPHTHSLAVPNRYKSASLSTSLCNETLKMEALSAYRTFRPSSESAASASLKISVLGTILVNDCQLRRSAETALFQRSENRAQRRRQVPSSLPYMRHCRRRQSPSLSLDIRQLRCAV